ncbi:hypothetical protein S324_01470 [Salmonella enterica subsp. enterica]|nr:hypothetical protein [Salmonella enterica subsp. enterica]
MTNYAKLGEYIALKRQAEDAAIKRSQILNDVIRELHRLSVAKNPSILRLSVGSLRTQSVQIKRCGRR